ncbi:MAG: thiol reductant ABC exporter subunit CydC [Actinobacteria bacterium]|nr:thiol reductant ABC exporter subunit CydC [Actinomycetota bacterium]MCL5445746.1 thiol reductant ABC exporter subunit CydC [Actinomycetota bacterium]
MSSAQEGLAPVRGRSGRTRYDVMRKMFAIGAPARNRMILATLLGVAASAATIGLLAGSGYVVDKAAFRPGLGAIAGILAVVEVMAFLRAPLRYAERLVGHDVAFKALSRWRVWLYDRLEPLSPAGLRAWRSGDLLSRFVEDVDSLQDLYLRALAPLVVAVASGILAVSVLTVLLPLAGLIVAVSLLAGLVLPAWLILAAGGDEEREAELRGELAADVVDLVYGAQELIAFGQQDIVGERVERADEELSRIARRRAFVSGAASTILGVFAGVAVVGVVVVTVLAAHAHQLGYSMVAVLPLTAIAAFESVPAVTQSALRAGGVAAAGRRLLALVDIPVPVVDPDDPVELDVGCPDVAFVDAKLRYADHSPWALDGVSFTIAAGAHTAIVGSSGSGKSSVVNVLLRFWKLDGGRATLGGVTIDRLAQSRARSVFALLDQRAFLFSGSIRHNLAMVDPNLSDAEFNAALTVVGLIEWVESLPEGLMTQIGDHGTKLSGGQRRRIALARAMLIDAPILLLDEPTAALDQETSLKIIRRILEDSGERTVVVITHDEEHLELFDGVVTIDGGKVVEFKR